MHTINTDLRIASFIIILSTFISLTTSYCQDARSKPSLSNIEWKAAKDRVYPMLKHILSSSDTAPVVQLKEKEEPISDDFLVDILVMYLLDFDSFYTYVNKGQLEKWRISHDSLRTTAISNLDMLANEKAQLHAEKDFGMIILNGNLEASLILSDNFWLNLSDMLNYEKLIVGVPARDVLLIANEDSEESIERLGEAIKRTYEIGYHVISKWMFKRENGSWVEFRYVK